MLLLQNLHGLNNYCQSVFFFQRFYQAYINSIVFFIGYWHWIKYRRVYSKRYYANALACIIADAFLKRFAGGKNGISSFKIELEQPFVKNGSVGKIKYIGA